MSAAIRITPQMINFLKRKLTGTSDDSPDSPPKIAPTIRTSDIAATDSLPPVQPQGFSTPDAGYQNVIRANNVSPPSITATSAQMPPAPQIQTTPIINQSLFDARATAPVMPTPSINTNQVIGRNPFADAQPSLADKYMATAQPYEEPSNAPVSSAIRPRITQSIDPLQRAAENAAAPVPPDFGQDKEGNQRTHAKRGIGGRAIAFAKDLGLNMLEGRGLIASAADATHAAFNPDILAERRAKVKTAENQQELATQLGIAGEQARIGQIRAQTQRASQPKVHYAKNAQGQPIKVTEGGNADGSDKVTILDNSKKVGSVHTTWGDDGVFRIYNEETRQFEPAHDENGQVITSDLKKPVKLKIGDETFTMSPNAAGSAAATADRFKIEKDIEGQKTANTYAIQRAEFERSEADRVEREQAKFDEDSGFVEDAQRRIGELKKEQAENEKLANDDSTHQAQASDGKWYPYPNRTKEERAQARARANSVRDEIGRLEGEVAKRKPVKPKPAQPFPDVQLTVPQGSGVSRAPQRSNAAPTSGAIRYQ